MYLINYSRLTAPFDVLLDFNRTWTDQSHFKNFNLNFYGRQKQYKLNWYFIRMDDVFCLILYLVNYDTTAHVWQLWTRRCPGRPMRGPNHIKNYKILIITYRYNFPSTSRVGLSLHKQRSNADRYNHGIFLTRDHQLATRIL